jgi:hypothetical protein
VIWTPWLRLTDPNEKTENSWCKLLFGKANEREEEGMSLNTWFWIAFLKTGEQHEELDTNPYDTLVHKRNYCNTEFHRLSYKYRASVRMNYSSSCDAVSQIWEIFRSNLGAVRRYPDRLFMVFIISFRQILGQYIVSNPLQFIIISTDATSPQC